MNPYTVMQKSSSPAENRQAQYQTVSAQASTGTGTVLNALRNPTSIYKFNKCEVLQGFYDTREGNKLVAAKVLQCNTDLEVNEKYAEVVSTFRIQHLPRTIQVYALQQYPSRSGFGTEVCIFMEHAEGGSLQDEIEKRQNQNNPFSEEQLFSFLFQIVELLAKSQELGICHRDIKPQNVLIMSDGNFKLADFGAAKDAAQQQTMYATLIGTPPYLSYVLFDEYRRWSLGDQTEKATVLHNPIKSDVVSVAIMILNMARLRQNSVLNNRTNAQEKQEEILRSFYNDTLKEVLRQMLSIEEETRPDFVQVDRYLQTLGIQQYTLTSAMASQPQPSQINNLRPTTPAKDHGSTMAALPPEAIPPTMPALANTIKTDKPLREVIANDLKVPVQPIMDPPMPGGRPLSLDAVAYPIFTPPVGNRPIAQPGYPSVSPYVPPPMVPPAEAIPMVPPPANIPPPVMQPPQPINVQPWGGLANFNSLPDKSVDAPVLVYLDPESRKIFKYDLASERLVSSTLDRLPFPFSPVGWNSSKVSWVLLNENKVFLCGGYDGKVRRAETFTFDFQTNSFEQKQNMLTARQSAGIYFQTGYVYIFGGFNTEKLRSCERYDVAANRWDNIGHIPSAEGIESVTVTSLHDMLYFTGLGTDQIFCYNPQNNAFNVLQCKLPHGEYEHHKIFTFEDFLWVIEGFQTHMILDSGEIIQSYEGYDSSTWYSGPTIYWNNRAYFVSAKKTEKDIYMFDFLERRLTISKANVFSS